MKKRMCPEVMCIAPEAQMLIHVVAKVIEMKKEEEEMRKDRGFIAFTSLLVISAATLAIAVSIALLGVGEAKASLDFAKGQEVIKIAEGCIEEGLLRIRDNASYTGGTLNLGSGSCTIAVSGSGSDRTILAVATLIGPPQYVKRIQATVKRAGNGVTLTSWTEMP